MKKSKTCSLRVQGNNGRKLSGTAAQLHYISSHGGWDQYERDLYMKISQAVATEVAEALLAHARSTQISDETPAPMENLMTTRISAMTATKGTRHVH